MKLLEWHNFYYNIQKILRGRIPKWFLEIQELISSIANPTTSYIYPNPFTLTKWKPKKKTWIITPNLTIGKTNHFDQKVTTI